MQLITAIIRVLQFIFAVIVLGLSVSLAKGQVLGNVPPVTGYAAFTGGLGIIAAIVGVTALFVSSLEGLITWALDGVACLAFLAGGIAFAVILRATDCGSRFTTEDNMITSGGCQRMRGEWYCGYVKSPDTLKSRCTSAKADSAFMIISCVVCVAVVASSFFSARKSAGGGGSWGV
ncbi:hypothetical protein FE257_003804 [Aspergillus nanangensis]|uniref:MARVEL domain-containing protein n=1 Tax=Aspergillus nanangensis TaxID=2582783 RepID=A0AAD4CCD7_ASPNN|nr:hypothetical protein FE257_003804 [Aspergillus nanangensis]